MRTTAVRLRLRRSTTALVKCVVPSITALTAPGAAPVSDKQLGQDRGDAAADVARGGRLCPADDAATVHENGIRVGAAHVNTDAHG